MVPEREPDRPALAVGATEGMLIEHAILARGPAQQFNFLFAEKILDNNKSMLPGNYEHPDR